jgi:predicted acetyltransferase
MDVRAITPDEIEAFYTTFFRTMGFGPPREEQLERDRRAFVHERSVAAFDAGEIVGTTYSHLFDLTLPGGGFVPAAGVTAVSVASTHRRQGIVSELMRRQLSEAHARGEAAAILIASEGRIYSRFGYGAATLVADVKVDTQVATMAAPSSGGRVRIVDAATADKVFPAVWDRTRTRAGSIGRPQHFWDSITADRDKRTIHAVFENASGEADGYVRYDVRAEWKDGLPAHKLTIGEMAACTDVAALELWWYLINVDLVREIEAWSRQMDDPLRWALVEPRALKTTTLRDMLWVRPLDVARLLASRTYTTDLDLCLEIADPLLGLGGSFALRGGPSGAECSRGDGAADLRMTVSELGSIVLGGVAPSDLARAGRIEEVRAGALRAADAAFVTHPRPWTGQYF